MYHRIQIIRISKHFKKEKNACFCSREIVITRLKTKRIGICFKKFRLIEQRANYNVEQTTHSKEIMPQSNNIVNRSLYKGSIRYTKSRGLQNGATRSMGKI